jgi:hypothetical protein
MPVFDTYLPPLIVCRVIDGSDSTLETMEKVPVNPKNRPLHEIKLESVRLVTNSSLNERMFMLFDNTGYDSCQPDRRRRSIEGVRRYCCHLGCIYYHAQGRLIYHSISLVPPYTGRVLS